MNRIPWKQIAFVCLGMVLLIAARSAVTVGKSLYYGYRWYVNLAEDPWFYVGIAAAALGLICLVIFAALKKINSRIKE